MNCDNASLLLYAVTDRSWLHGQTLYAQAEQALQGGATFLQLREKELDEAHFKEEAVALKALCRQYGVPFLPSEFRKKDGYKRSLQLSAEYGLYRQDYCGCEFSARSRAANPDE